MAATVIVDLSVSLDGFVAGTGDGPSSPLGNGGEAVFAWMAAGGEENRVDPRISPPDASLPIVREWMSEGGAIISGRRTFDIAGGWADGHPVDVPIFVVTHHAPTEGRWSPQVRFVTDGLASALTQAREVAGDKIISVNGPDIAQQLLDTDDLDEIQVSIAPVLLGGGVRLFDLLPQPIALEQIRSVPSDGVTHLRYRIIKD